MQGGFAEIRLEELDFIYVPWGWGIVIFVILDGEHRWELNSFVEEDGKAVFLGT